MFLRTLFAAAALTACVGAHSAVVFSDNFDADVLALNQTSFVGGWAVGNGTVDVIGDGFFDFYPGNGRYIDLDGSTGDAGVFSKTLSLVGGVTYSASFILGGSTRGDSNLVDVTFGSASASYLRASGDPYALAAPILFTPGSSGDYTLSFANAGGDNLGAILDNVTVSSVTAPIPEPETYALMLVGLAAMGAMVRRRKAR